MSKSNKEKTSNADSNEDAIKTKQSERTIMYTVISLVAFGVGVTIFANFLPDAWRDGNRTALIYCFTGIIVFAAIGSGAAMIALGPTQDKPITTDLIRVDDRLVRPYLTVIDAAIVPLRVGTRPIVLLHIQNSGNTPAVDVMVGSNLQIGDLAFFPNGGYHSIDEPRVSLGKDQKIGVTIQGDEPLTNSQMEGLSSGLKELMAHGEIRFTSDPPPSVPYKPLRFCYAYNPALKSVSPCDNRGFINRDKAIFR